MNVIDKIPTFPAVFTQVFILKRTGEDVYKRQAGRRGARTGQAPQPQGTVRNSRSLCYTNYNELEI